MMVPDLMTMNGGQFITLYLLLFGAAFVLSWIFTVLLRPEGAEQDVSDSDQLAMLSGGKARLIESRVAHLLTIGAIRLQDRKRFTIDHRGQSANAIDAEILRASSPATWADIKAYASSPADAVHDQLVARDLMASPAATALLRAGALLPFGLLLMLGLFRLMLGVEGHTPFGILIILLIGTSAIMLWRWYKIDRRTKAGVSAVNEAKARADRLQIAPLPDEIGTAVALFGTTVLAGSAYQDLHHMRKTQSDGGGCGSGGGGFFDGGSSDSGSSDGGCGGGCGGCGS